MVKNPPVNAADMYLIPGLGRFPGEGNGNSFQYSCLGNPMDRGAWRGTVLGVTESDMTEVTEHAYVSISEKILLTVICMGSSVSSDCLLDYWEAEGREHRGLRWHLLRSVVIHTFNIYLLRTYSLTMGPLSLGHTAVNKALMECPI